MRTYAKRNMPEGPSGAAPSRAESGPSIASLAAGAAPTAQQMGTRVDLPGEIREKMENAFGADFSNVRLYESDTVAQAGAQAVTQGTNIAFAPGKLDLTSTSGQALLGHELSHVVSQARGESAGRGFLKDASLEAQADRQGAMAARGESVYTGPVSPVGTGTAAASAGPMQASKESAEDRQLREAVSEATKTRKVSFGDADLTMQMRNARYNQTVSTLNANNGPLMNRNFLEGTVGTGRDTGDVLDAYTERFTAQNIRDLRMGTTAQALPETSPLPLLGGGMPREERLSAEEGQRRYNAAHPEDALSGYDRAIAGGRQSILDLIMRRRNAAAAGGGGT